MTLFFILPTKKNSGNKYQYHLAFTDFSLNNCNSSLFFFVDMIRQQRLYVVVLSTTYRPKKILISFFFR
ncbi:unknown protein [Desulfotalea psychrophila LSv54]|uniref:Uncharacterized protein n=1 Tax=Desulfotalea psychrophila (strain LSv54 / DSM 12343) TaxID=177439 RepID=Q6AIK7_DESPS|nr:unknown protein [Desulfotalea psychrophila LSv54]